MDTHDLRHAYAILGISPPVTEEALKHHYRELVKRWHPDRFQSDPEGQAEAAARLRAINIAYETVADSLQSPAEAKSAPHTDVTNSPDAGPADNAPGAAPWNNRPESGKGSHPPNQVHLTPEQIDAIVDSINRGRRPPWWGKPIEMRLSLVVYVGSLLLGAALHPATRNRSTEVFELALGLAIPVFLIWVNSIEDDGGVRHWLARVFCWLLLLTPAILTVVVWATR